MKKNYHSHLSFLDLLFNTLLCFAALFLLSFLLINPSKNENNVQSKADFIISVTWPPELDNDVDTYVRDPQGNLVGFMRREEGLMHLDRDDLGKSNDTIQTPFGPVEYPENKELVTLRGYMSGEYIVNIHMYTKRASAPQTEVTVQLDKLNPSIKTIIIKKVILKNNGDEKTAFRFILNKDGEVKEISELPISFFKRARDNG